MRRSITASSLYAVTITVTVGSTVPRRAGLPARRASNTATAGYTAWVQTSAARLAQKRTARTVTGADSTLGRVRRAGAIEVVLLAIVLAADAFLLTRSLHV